MQKIFIFLIIFVFFSISVDGRNTTMASSILPCDSKLVVSLSFQKSSDSETLKFWDHGSESQEKSGSNDQKTSSSKIGNWLNYVLPVFTLLLGIFIRRKIEDHTHKKQLENAGKRWFAELQTLNQPIERQLKSLHKFLEELDKNEFQPREMQVYAALDGEIFKSLDKHSLIRFLEFTYKRKDYDKVVKTSNSIFGFTIMLSQLHQTLKGKFTDFQNLRTVQIKVIDQSLTDFEKGLRHYYSQLKADLDGDPSESTRFKPFFEIYKNQIVPYKREPDFNSVDLEKRIYHPLSELLNDLSADPRTMDMDDAVSSGFKAINEIKNEKQYLYRDVKTLIVEYETQEKKLKEITVRMREAN